jgi:hypothetical protein
LQPPPSNLLIPPPTYACRKWLSTLHVDNGQSLCMLHNILFLSLAKKVSYIHPRPLTQNFKEKNSRHIECMLSLPIGNMNFVFPKLFVTIFGLG